MNLCIFWVPPTLCLQQRAIRSPHEKYCGGIWCTSIAPFRNPYGLTASIHYHGIEAKNAALQEAAIDEIEMDSSEMTELDKLAEETRKCGISWEHLKAELAL